MSENLDLARLEAEYMESLCRRDQIERFEHKIFKDIDSLGIFDVLISGNNLMDEGVLLNLEEWGFGEVISGIVKINEHIKYTIRHSRRWCMHKKINGVCISNVPYSLIEYNGDKSYYDGLTSESITRWCSNISDRLKNYHTFYLKQLKEHSRETKTEERVSNEDIDNREIPASFLEFYNRVRADFVRFGWFKLLDRLNFFTDDVIVEYDVLGLRSEIAGVQSIKRFIANPLSRHLQIFLSLQERYENPQLIAMDEDYAAKLEEYESMPTDRIERWCNNTLETLTRYIDEYFLKWH